jgi:cleavage and polyadenylation specificity factor subunit 1
MDRVVAGCNPAFAYLDDVLIGSPSREQHLLDVADVFRRLQAAGLVVNREKCQFSAESLDFLGHRVSAAGITPLPQRVAALRRHPRPGTVKELQGFLGTVNFYRRFIKGAAHLLRTLTDVLRGSPPPASAVTWTAEMDRAFLTARESLARKVELVHPCSSAQLSLCVDASADHVGAVLQQRASPSAAWQALGFFSQKLSPAQVNYSAFDRELLACVEAIRHFRFMLEGSIFTLFTDHKPLTFALHKVSEPWSARQSRHLSYVAEFTTDIQHVPGVDNVVADTLSRPPAALVAAPSPSPTRLYPVRAPLRAGGYGPASTGPTGPAPSSPARLYPGLAPLRAAGYVSTLNTRALQ